MGRVLSLDDLISTVGTLKSDGKTVVQCHGVFDVFHVGHLKHLEEAKSFGDVLVVTVTPDKFVNKGPDRPLFSALLRAEMVAGLGVVDYVAINEYPTAVEAIIKIEPNIYVKGTEYKELVDDAIVDEEEALKSINGELRFTNGIVFSSSKLINLFKLSDETKEYLNNFKFTCDEVIGWLDRITNIKVLVVGETIVDEYQYGDSIGKSGKSPIVALKLGRKEVYSGGTWAIQRHLHGFVGEVSIVRSNTITIKRYIENNQKLFETYDLSDDHPDIFDEVASIIDNYDLVLVADFGHGLLTGRLRALIKQKSKFLAVATQRNAGNMGHNTIRKYWDRKDNIYICIDGDELRLAVHEKYDRTYPIIDILRDENLNNYIVTVGPKGCIVDGKSIPAMTTDVVDAVGAGDAFLAITSPLVYVGAPMELVGFVGCVAAAIKISYVGNKSNVDKNSLTRYIKTLLKR